MLRMRSQTSESKKSRKTSNASSSVVVVWARILTAGFFLRTTLRQTRSPRSRRVRPRRARRRSTARRCFVPWYACGSDGSQVREQIERTCDEERARGTGRVAGSPESLVRTLDRLHVNEVRCRGPGEVLGPDCPGTGRRRRDETVAQGRERGQHPGRVLVCEDGGDDDTVVARGQTGNKIADAGEVV